MPRRYPLTGAGILQWLVLNPFSAEAQSTAERQQPLPIGADQVHHGLPAHAMPVKPNAAVESVAHALTAAFKLTIGRLYVQVILPSVVAVPTGVAPPEYK